MKKTLKDFREFAMKGNVVDLAVGIIIGGAFGKIISSLVSDVIMPFLGILLGKINLVSLQWSPVPSISVKYGSFLQAILDFMIIALSIFFAVKVMNKLKSKQEEEAIQPKISEEAQLLTEIRDILKEKNEG